jgi:toxic protein SymE
MSDSERGSPADPNQNVGLGLNPPKSLRIAALEHPAGDVLPPGVAIPYISMCGMWLERLGFKSGHRVLVTGEPGVLTLKLDDKPVELPYRYRKHTPRKRRLGAVGP